MLIGAPPSSGKSLCAEFAILRLFGNKPAEGGSGRCVYIAPFQSVAETVHARWHNKFSGLGIR